jgi:RNA polymerase sigma-70 factor (ECF subfamily)
VQKEGLPHPTDDELIARACNGEAEAFGVLVTRYEGRLFNFLVRYVGHREAARDLCQEAFLKAFKGLPGFRVGAPFKPWLYRVAVNTANSHLRRGSRREVGVDALPEHERPFQASTAQVPPEVDMQALANQDAAAVQRALSLLPENYREAVVLKYVEDFSYEEMAEVLGTKVSALKMRVQRGLQRLRELMEGGPAGGRP